MGRLTMAALVEEGGTHAVRSLPEPQAPVVNTSTSEGGRRDKPVVDFGFIRLHNHKGFGNFGCGMTVH